MKSSGEFPIRDEGWRQFHEPVLGAEAIRLLAPSAGSLYLDGTVGGGGHSHMILSAAHCRLVGCDRDPEAIAEARRALADFGTRARLLLSNFTDVVADREIQRVGLGGAILDLGVSSHQLDDGSRGFSYLRGLPLDMRMDARPPVRATASGAPVMCGGRQARASPVPESAAQLLARSTRAELGRLFRDFGDVPRHGALATAVARRCRRGRMTTSDDLVAAVAISLGRSPTAREKARVFQAVRIAVNDELGSLTKGLTAIRDTLLAGAVFVVISYHSLEDRIVKHSFREWSHGCTCPPDLPGCACGKPSQGEVITHKPVRPTDAEVAANPRARSARLRAWRKAA